MVMTIPGIESLAKRILSESFKQLAFDIVNHRRYDSFRLATDYADNS